MKRSYVKSISLLLVIILLIVSCSNGTQESELGLEESDAIVVEDHVEETDDDLSKNEDENEALELEVTKAEETTVIKPTESEIELFNQLAGGFFYTRNSEDDYSEMRNKSIDFFNDQIITVLEDGYDFYTGGIKSYEDKLLLFIGNIDGLYTQYNDDFQYIINRIMAYKTEINALVNLSNEYFEKIENYQKDDVKKAVVYGEIFETTVKFYEKLDEYLLFLASTREYLASGIIEDFNKDYALTVRQHTTEVFEEEIVPEFVEVIKAYDQMALTYTLINSGDYFYTKSISANVVAQLESLEDVEGISEIKEAFIQEITNPSNYILTVQNEEETSFRIPFIKKVYAQEYNFVEYNNFMEIHKFIDKLSIDPNITEEELDEALMSLVLQKHNVYIEKTKDKIEETKKEAPELLVPETILALGGEKLMELAGADPVYGFGGIEGTIFPIKLDAEQVERQKEINASKINQEVKKEIIDKAKREKMIEKIKEIQSSDEATGGNLLMLLSPEVGGNFVYDKVIKSLTDVLEENENKMKGETFQSLNQLLENDLEVILGSKKSEFTNKILNASADEMVSRFTEWVNNSKNRKDLEINKDTLISFLDAMGFEHEGAFDSEEDLETVDEKETEVVEESDKSFEGEYDEEILLDYLSYMLPHMDNVNPESLETGAAELGISKEELYIYAMTTLVIKTVNVIGGKEKTEADEIRLVNGLEAFLNGEEALDPWVRDYSLNMFYELFNEKGDLDRWEKLSKKEKEELIKNALNKEENTEVEEEEKQVPEEESETEEAIEETTDINDSNHFVFHRQDNGNVNAEHTFSPYNDDYTRRDTITYYEEGSIETKGSFLITKEASELMIQNYMTVIERQENAKPGDFIPKPLEAARQNYFKIGIHKWFTVDGKMLSSIEYDMEGNILLNKSWQYYDDGSLKKYSEMDGNDTGSVTHYESAEYGGGKKYTDVFENNKAINRINYD